jgi:pimeloyl-ACP methyl ester carboxylesterase
MAPAESSRNPFALPGAPAPAAGWYDVNGCRLYAEVRGTGPALLIVGAASDDAEMFRPIAERLAGSSAATGFTVVTRDPRGTRRSGRNGWPCDSSTHADDAAALLTTLGLAPAAVFGASAGGIVAVRLALRHAPLVRRVVVYEPGFFRATAAGTALLGRAVDAIESYLGEHPGDWTGAAAGVADADAAAEADADAAAPEGRARPAERDSTSTGRRGLLEAPPGLEWYTQQAAGLAENFIRDDVPATQETVDPALLHASGTDIRFAYGTASAPVFRGIAEWLTRARRRVNTHAPGSSPDADEPDAVAGAAHLGYFTPDPIADYIRARCLPHDR